MRRNSASSGLPALSARACGNCPVCQPSQIESQIAGGYHKFAAHAAYRAAMSHVRSSLNDQLYAFSVALGRSKQQGRELPVIVNYRIDTIDLIHTGRANSIDQERHRATVIENNSLQTRTTND